MYQILQHDNGVITSWLGRTETVPFVELAFAQVDREIVWEGKGVDEVGKDAANGDILVRIDPRYFRPAKLTC